jgi:MFS family permease
MNIQIFKAFGSRNYRLYFFGQSTSLIGTWMQRTAVYWLVYVHTQSAVMLGAAVFAAQFPSFLFSPLGGVVSDRFSRYKVMLVTQIASLIQAILLAVLIIFVNYSVWEIFALSILLGTINAFDVPARQAMVHELLNNKDDLPNAIALNSSMVNLAKMIGPAISGIVLEEFGAGDCFLINALSFLAVIVSLLLMRFPKFIPHPNKKKVFKEFKEGFNYLKNNPSLGYVILLLAFVSLFVLPFITLLPVYAGDIFIGNASTFGYLNSFIGVGAIGGAIYLASLKTGADLKKILFINLLIFGIGLILFSHTTNLALALIFIMISGFGMMSQVTVSNTIIQTNVSKEMRGRVISYYAMAFFGMQPLGGLLIGSISESIGAPNTIMAAGIAALLIAFIFLPFLRKDILKKREKIELIELEDSTVVLNEV